MSRFRNKFTFLAALSALALPACSKDTILLTSTATGISADGDISAAPDHINVGFRRRELIYSGANTNPDTSVLAAIDSTTTWQRGSAITQTTATGYAAELVASDGTAERQGDAAIDDQPLIFVSDTTVGIKAVLVPESAGQSPSAVLGYKRKLVTRVRADENGTLPSTYSHVSVHSASLNGQHLNGGVDATHQLSDNSEDNPDQTKKFGARVRQSFAIGSAAEHFLKGDPEVAAEAKKQLIDKPEAETETPAADL